MAPLPDSSVRKERTPLVVHCHRRARVRCDTGQQSFCQATVFPAMVMVVGCEENLTEARMSSHASALLNTRGCSHSSEWKKLQGRVMYPFSIFADYRHFADSERKNREKGREMPWHFRIDVRVKRECPFGAEPTVADV